MAILEGLASWFVELFMDWLLKRAKSDIAKELKRLEEKMAQDKLNEENAKAYEEAQDRAKRIDEALNLLNRTP